MQEQTVVGTSPRPRRSRVEPFCLSEGPWLTTPSDGRSACPDRLSLYHLAVCAGQARKPWGTWQSPCENRCALSHPHEGNTHAFSWSAVTATCGLSSPPSRRR